MHASRENRALTARQHHTYFYDGALRGVILVLPPECQNLVLRILRVCAVVRVRVRVRACVRVCSIVRERVRACSQLILAETSSEVCAGRVGSMRSVGQIWRSLVAAASREGCKNLPPYGRNSEVSVYVYVCVIWIDWLSG